MIAEVLPRYYELTGDELQYTIIRSIVISGHEVAVVEITGTAPVDPSVPEGDSQRFWARKLVCECDFLPGIGFVVDGGEVVGIIGEDGEEPARGCLYRQSALHLVHLELREEYRQRYQNELFGAEVGLLHHAGDIILDLIESAASVGD